MRWLDAVLGRTPVVEHAQNQGPSFEITRDQIAASYFGLATWSDVGGIVPRVTRAEAIQVPAVKRARDLICPTIGGMPLSVYDTERVELVNDLLTQPERHCARSISITQLVEDLLFEQVAWWRVTERGFDGYPRFVKRVCPDRVSVDEVRGLVKIDGQTVDSRDLIRFDSPNDALLVAGARAIRTLLRLDAAAANAADGIPPMDWFTPGGDSEPVDDDEVLEILGDWQTARRARRTAWIPTAVDYHQGANFSPEQLQLIETRQHAVLEVARAAGVDAEELSVSTTSRTYSNTFDRRKQFVDFTLGAYLTAVEQRLSLGDVTKRGYYVKFNLDAFYRSDALSRYQAYSAGLQVGALDQSEIRPMEDKPDMTEAPMPQTASAQAAHFSESGETETLTVGFEAVEFAVDQEQRTLTGMLLPFGEVSGPTLDPTTGRTARFSFGEGTVMLPDDPIDAVLNYGHDKQSLYAQVGAAAELSLTPKGVVAKFNVAETPEGDRVLALAKARVLKSFSAEVDGEFTPDKAGVMHAKAAIVTGAAVVRKPAFAGAHITSVAASAVADSKEGETMTDPQVTTPAEAPVSAPEFSAAQMEQLKAMFGPKPEGANGPEVIPAAAVALSVTEPAPYQFDRGGNFLPGEHVFSADLHDMARAHDEYGNQTEAGKRVMGLLQATFATTPTGNVTDLNPTIQRPDMFVDQRDYKTPLWDSINKGAPPNGVNPFRFPKFSASSGLVADHVEGTEPTSGSYTATGQTVTPTALSGKASITREVWDMGGNPAVSTLIFNQMKRGYSEGLESAAATFLNTLTAATDISLGTAATDAALSSAWDAALADLQFIRGYDFNVFALEKELYKKFAGARDGSARPLYPILAPQNANGTSASRFRTLDLSGVLGIPSWALASTAGSPNNSWLFDSSTVHGWASTPMRLEFPGTASAGGYAPVAMVDLAIWGYKALANSDIAGVRQVIYDTV